MSIICWKEDKQLFGIRLKFWLKKFDNKMYDDILFVLLPVSREDCCSGGGVSKVWSVPGVMEPGSMP